MTCFFGFGNRDGSFELEDLLQERPVEKIIQLAAGGEGANFQSAMPFAGHWLQNENPWADNPCQAGVVQLDQTNPANPGAVVVGCLSPSRNNCRLPCQFGSIFVVGYAGHRQSRLYCANPPNPARWGQRSLSLCLLSIAIWAKVIPSPGKYRASRHNPSLTSRSIVPRRIFPSIETTTW